MSGIESYRKHASVVGNLTVRLDKQNSTGDTVAVKSSKENVFTRLGHFLSDTKGVENKRVKQDFLSAFTKTYGHLADLANSLVDVTSRKPLKGRVIEQLLNKAENTPAQIPLTYAGISLGPTSLRNDKDVEVAFEGIAKKLKLGPTGSELLNFATKPDQFVQEKYDIPANVSKLTNKYYNVLERRFKEAENKKSDRFNGNDEAIVFPFPERRIKKYADNKREELTNNAVFKTAAEFKVTDDLRMLFGGVSPVVVSNRSGAGALMVPGEFNNLLPVSLGKVYGEEIAKIKGGESFNQLSELGKQLTDAVANNDQEAIRDVGEKILEVAKDVETSIKTMVSLLSKPDVKEHMIDHWCKLPKNSLDKEGANSNFNEINFRVQSMEHYVTQPNAFLQGLKAFGAVAMEKPEKVLALLGKSDVQPQEPVEMKLDGPEPTIVVRTPGDHETIAIPERQLTDEDVGGGNGMVVTPPRNTVGEGQFEIQTIKLN